jgi:hypothetical protein
MKLSWLVALSLLVTATGALAGTPPNEQAVKSPDGKTVAVLILCDTCPAGHTGSRKDCHTGSQDGWIGSRPCGQCLLKANPRASFQYPVDLHFTGILTDAAGKPAKNRFVKLFMANGWTVRTKTADDGAFRLRLGATAPRKSHKPVVTDIGTRVDAIPGKDADYALFLMPPSYNKQCTAAALKKHPGHNEKKK